MANKIINGTTCFVEHARFRLTCKKESCRQWIDNPSSLNCTILATTTGPKTLQHIGTLFGLTRMRICQIEKMTMEKLQEIEQLSSENQ